MKSKSFNLKDNSTAEHKLNKIEDFIGLYKSAAETKKIAEKRKSDDSFKIEAVKIQSGSTSKRERSPYKNKKRGKSEQVEVSQLNIDGASLNSSAQSTSSSTPIVAKSRPQSGKVKSIMKSASLPEQSTENLDITPSSSKPSKKRNKSVSFMLEDNEDVVIKRTKSNESIQSSKKNDKPDTNSRNKKRNIKTIKSDQQSEKENKASDINVASHGHRSIPHIKQIAGKKSKKILADTLATPAAGDTELLISEKKNKLKKNVMKVQLTSSPEPIDTENINDEIVEPKTKKLKKKKATKSVKLESGEPKSKQTKRDTDPDISEDLENLSISDNAHTLTNLLDDMTVVDKNNKKKLKQKLKKKKVPKEKVESEQEAEVKEKVKWKKRKWNKDRKGEVDDENLNTVIVEGLPLSIMLDYKKLLTDHFIKYGLIKKIGIAEVYPTEESKPVFTTTINFYSDGAAEQALEENNSQFEGSRIRVKRALPATQTTVVARSYAELTDQGLSSLFVQAGKIRTIRHLVKGKKSMSTAFIEFDGPEAVERAIKIAADIKTGGKKIHIARFEHRVKKQKKHKSDAESAADADSEASNE